MKAYVRTGMLLLLAAGVALSAPLTWTVTGSFDDGGSLSGSFTYDADTGSISNFNLTTTSGSTLSGYNYTPSDSLGYYSATELPVCTANCFEFSRNDNLLYLLLEFPTALTDAGGTVNFVIGGTNPNSSYECTNCGTFRALTSGSATAPVPQTLRFPSIANQLFGIPPFPITAETNQLLPVTFSSTTPTVCKVAGELVQLLNTGPCSITASQAGNASFQPASATKSFTISQANAAGTLSQSGTLTAASAPGATVIADVNGDGLPDIIVSEGDVGVFLNNGSGGFTAAPNSPFTAGTPVEKIAVGDFNGDGKVDLAVAADSATAAITILLGDGTGNFTPAGSATGSIGGPFSVVVGDFNSDGIQDLATTGNGSDVVILTGNGDGTFTVDGTTTALDAAGRGLAEADFDGDGKADLVAVAQSADEVEVLIGSGTGTFSINATTGKYTVPGQPSQVVTGDFNNDGKSDFAVSLEGGSGPNAVVVFLGNGAGSFTQQSPITVPDTTPRAISVGDFNGDGNPDIAVVGAGISILLGDGTGNFTVNTGSPFTFVGTGSGPQQMGVGDLNGDGIEDFALPVSSPNDVVVVLGALASTGSTLGTSSPSTIPVGTNVSLALSVSNGGSAFNSIAGTATFFDGSSTLGNGAQSGNNYSFTASGLTAGNHTFSATYNGGAGNAASTSNTITIDVQETQTITFSAPPNVTLPQSPFSIASYASASSGLTVQFSSNSTSVCTVNADDVVTVLIIGTCSITASQPGDGVNYAAATPVTKTFQVLGEPQSITFDAIPNQLFGIPPFPIAAQSNSLLPITLTSNQPSICKTSGSLVAMLTTGTCSITASQAGNSTYAAATSVTRTFNVTLANPSGTLIAASNSPFQVGTDPNSVAVGDFNGDGIPDLAVANYGANSAGPGGSVTVLLGDGAGNFTQASNSPIPVPTSQGGNPYSIASGDFNADGHQDIAVASVYTDDVTVLLGNGDGTFAQASGSPFSVGSHPQQPFFITVGDFNNDGIQDLVTANAAGNSVTVLLGNGSGGFTSASFAVGHTPESIAVGDFNNDGAEDLAVSNVNSNNVTVLLGNGSGGFSPASGSPLAVGTNPFSIVTADFNGDGKLDLATANEGSSNVTVLLGNGSGGFSSGTSYSVGATFFLTAADLNGDGAPDLILSNGVVLLGDGAGAFTQAANSYFAGSPLAVADFNQDGLEDVAGVNNGSPGSVTVLLGSTVATTSTLSTTSPSTVPVGTNVPLTLTVTDNSSTFNTLTGTATFFDSSTSLGNASQSTSQYTFTATGLTAGNHTFSAQYSGGSGSAASTSNTITIDVQQAQTITFGSLSGVTLGVSPFAISATASSNLPVVFTSNSPSVCTLNGATVTIHAGGTCSITATQAGNTTYSAATPVTQTFRVSYPPLTISINPGSTSTTLGGSVSASFSANGGDPPYTYSASGLPPGVTLGSGSFGGSPTQAGAFTPSVTVTDSTGSTNFVSVTINVLGLTTTALPSGTAGLFYAVTIGASGGSNGYTFAASGLPAGMSFTSYGYMNGTVTTAGVYPIGISVSSGGLTASATLTLTIAKPQPLSISSAALPSGPVNMQYSAALSASGGLAPYTWSVSSGAPPAGLSLSTSGTVSGTPTAPGAYSFGVMVTDTAGSTATSSAGITIQPAPLVFPTTQSLPSGMFGVDYPQQQLTVTGGVAPYTWTVSSGSLPSGMTLTSDGLLGGTPQPAPSSSARKALVSRAATGGSATSYSADVTVTDNANTETSSTISFDIRQPGASLILTAATLSFAVATPATNAPPPQTVGVQSTDPSQLLSYTLSVSPAVSWLSVANGTTTPDSISVSLTQAALSLAVGAYQTTLTATCTSTSCAGSSQSVTVSLNITAAPPQLQIQNSLLSFATTNTAGGVLSQSINVSNSGGGSLGFASVSCEAPWCGAGGAPSSLTGGASAAIPVTVDPTGLGPGFYRTQVDIVTSAGRGAVAVTLFISASATMTLAPAGAQFNMLAGGSPGNPTGSFLVAVNSSSISWSAAIVSLPNFPAPGWLVLQTTGGSSTSTQPGTVTFSIDPAAAGALAPGAYYGAIEVSSPDVSNSPEDFEVVLNVASASTPVVPEPQPGGLLFIGTAGGVLPPETVTVYSASTAAATFQASATTLTGGSWLSVSPTTGSASTSAPGATLVSVDTSKLAPGVYQGSVSYSLSATAVRSVNVTLIATGSAQATTSAANKSSPHAAGCSASRLVPAQTGLVNSFSQPAGWPTLLQISLSDDCGAFVTNGQIVATFSNGDPPLGLPVVNATQGLYSATWAPAHPSSQTSISVTANAPGFAAATSQITGSVIPNAVPVITPNGAVHGFDPLVGGALAPGTIIAIYGKNLAASALQANAVPLPTIYNGTSALIGGMPAPLYYVSPGQVNAQIPFELVPGSRYDVLISANGALTNPQPIQLTPATPGLAALPDGTLIAQHADGSLVSAMSPATAGEYLVSYLAGLGDTNVPVQSGGPSPSSPLAEPQNSLTLTINGTQYPTAFVGLTPGLVGLYQMNFQVPPGLPAGNLTITVSQNGVASNQTVLPYQP